MSVADLKRDLASLDPEELCDPDMWIDVNWRSCPIGTLAMKQLGYSAETIENLAFAYACPAYDPLSEIVHGVAVHYSVPDDLINSCIRAYDGEVDVDEVDEDREFVFNHAARLRAVLDSLEEVACV